MTNPDTSTVLPKLLPFEIAARAVAAAETISYPTTKKGRAEAEQYVNAHWPTIWAIMLAQRGYNLKPYRLIGEASAHVVVRPDTGIDMLPPHPSRHPAGIIHTDLKRRHVIALRNGDAMRASFLNNLMVEIKKEYPDAIATEDLLLSGRVPLPSIVEEEVLKKDNNGGL